MCINTICIKYHKFVLADVSTFLADHVTMNFFSGKDKHNNLLSNLLTCSMLTLIIYNVSQCKIITNKNQQKIANWELFSLNTKKIKKNSEMITPTPNYSSKLLDISPHVVELVLFSHKNQHLFIMKEGAIHLLAIDSKLSFLSLLYHVKLHKTL